ncbi:MAG: triose-phosphate isomerase [Chloroflexota bacterium]|nr:triose-phosphate isomerase [Chloroflexota bacterium]
MRIPIIAGNWKMYKNAADSIAFVQALTPAIDALSGVEKVLCPAFVALAGVADALRGTSIKVGAQNTHWKDEGAFTSQIAPSMLIGLVEYVIVGHSECRQYLGDTDYIVNRKARALLAHGLKPIIAVGESLEQNEAGDTDSFVSSQVRAALAGIDADAMQHVVIAYEPIWAIGTGKSASPEIAQQIVGGTVRRTLTAIYGAAIADTVRIQYGGSVKPDNMADYMRQPDIDGALVGGASLKVDQFTSLLKTAAEIKGGSS